MVVVDGVQVKPKRATPAQKAKKEATRVRSQQDRYLAAVGKVGTLTGGCRAARCSPNTVYAWRELDEEFGLRENQARAQFADQLEEEAVRRAWHGFLRPIYQQGQRVGFEPVYSDNLLWNLLKALRPEKYRDRLDMNVASIVKEVAGFDPSSVL
jgi:hypothetical protein